MPLPLHSVFDPNKHIVIADNNRLPAYDGSRLYGVRPMSMKIEVPGEDVPDRIQWNDDKSGLVLTHGMGCYPIVTVLNSESQIVSPETTYISESELSLDFGFPISIPAGSNWLCLLTYGCRFGEDMAVISDGIEYVESWPENPELNRLYVTQSGARVYYTSTSHVDFPVLNQYGYIRTTVTTIPPSTSEYILFDCASGMNDGSWQYIHEPDTPPFYTLPNVDDTSVEHCVILTVKFTSTISAVFQDESGNTIATANEVPVSEGDVVEYLCKYDPLQSKWVVFGYHLN